MCFIFVVDFSLFPSCVNRALWCPMGYGTLQVDAAAARSFPQGLLFPGPRPKGPGPKGLWSPGRRAQVQEKSERAGSGTLTPPHIWDQIGTKWVQNKYFRPFLGAPRVSERCESFCRGLKITENLQKVRDLVNISAPARNDQAEPRAWGPQGAPSDFKWPQRAPGALRTPKRAQGASMEPP